MDGAFMTEPTYEYVKGKGWIACCGVITYEGASFTLVRKIPERNGFYIAVHKQRKFNTTDVIKDYNANYLEVWLNRFPIERDPENYDYFTLVPL